MKKTVLRQLRTWILPALLLVPSALQAVETGPALGPAAVIPETFFEFPDAVEGEYILHDFVVQNTGTSVLNIDVKTT
jgi:hypothetical protein